MVRKRKSRQERLSGLLRGRSLERPALTLMETVIALAIMAVVLAVLLPQFRNVQNSWSSRQGGSEALQSGRILTDHLQRNLSKAVRITQVSSAAEPGGHIQYEAADGLTYRYEVSADKQVMFGPPGDLSELAGPVAHLQFLCYDAFDLDTPITDTNAIRAVRAKSLLVNAAETGSDKPFETLVYLRSNSQGAMLTAGASSSFGITTGNSPVLAAIDPTHYLCAFTGQGDDGFAVVLTVDTGAVTVRSETAFEYDAVNCLNPALERIDATRFLCVYEGPQGNGHVIILRVNPASWAVDWNTSQKFDTKVRKPALSRIDANHFLCTYEGGSRTHGYAVVFRVDPSLMTVAWGPPFPYDTSQGATPAVKQLDASRFLCAYQGWSGWIWAAVLTVNTSTLTVSKEASYSLGLGYGESPALARIDSTRFLCVYSGNASDGMAVVLTVEPGSWLITRANPLQYDVPLGNIPAVIQAGRNMQYLCAYQGYMSQLWGIVLVVDPSTWNIRAEQKTVLSTWKALRPNLARVDDYNYLCVHEDQINKGWGLLLNLGGLRP